MIHDDKIDGGKGFDWGKASEDYARFRDIYPPEFYQKLLDAGICTKGQKILDLGTGTGVLPRNLYGCGALFTGADISEEQIGQARQLCAEADMDIPFLCCPAEELPFPDDSFDAVTACQCFFYFNHETLAPKLYHMIKPGGLIAALYLAWLPGEDAIAGASEELVLRYNPSWSGCGEYRHPIEIPDVYSPYFQLESSEVFDLQIPFTKESWNGRMKACRGIGASLSPEKTADFEKEHLALLDKIAPEKFSVLHYAAVAVLKSKKTTAF